MSKAIDYLTCPKCGYSMKCIIREKGYTWQCENKRCRKTIFEPVKK